MMIDDFFSHNRNDHPSLIYLQQSLSLIHLIWLLSLDPIPCERTKATWKSVVWEDWSGLQEEIYNYDNFQWLLSCPSQEMRRCWVVDQRTPHQPVLRHSLSYFYSSWPNFQSSQCWPLTHLASRDRSHQTTLHLSLGVMSWIKQGALWLVILSWEILLINRHYTDQTNITISTHYSFNIWLSESQLVFSLNLKYFFQIMIGCEVYLEVSCIKSSSQDVNIHMESCNCVSGQFSLHTEIVRYNCWCNIFSLDPALT